MGFSTSGVKHVSPARRVDRGGGSDGRARSDPMYKKSTQCILLIAGAKQALLLLRASTRMSCSID